MLLVTNERLALGLFRGDPSKISRPLLPAVRAGLAGDYKQQFMTSETFRIFTIKLWLFALALAVGYIGVSRIVDAL
jgi:hypothetical protein